MEINEEKSRCVDVAKDGSFGFLGFEFRRVRSLRGSWRAHYTPKLKKRTDLGADAFQCGSTGDMWGRTPWSQAELSNANFRVRVRYGGLLSSISLDLLQVNVHYATYTEPRSILQLNATTRLEFSGQSVRLMGFPAGTLTYVDRAAGCDVDTAYHHIVVVSPSAIDVSALRIGAASSAPLAFDGILDEVKLFTQPLSAADLETLSAIPACR